MVESALPELTKCEERWPHLVKRAVLLAPAIDNFERPLAVFSAAWVDT